MLIKYSHVKLNYISLIGIIIYNTMYFKPYGCFERFAGVLIDI